MIVNGSAASYAFRVPPYLRPMIYLHTQEAFPNEACGVIIDPGTEGQILTYRRITNIHEDPENGFTLDPGEYEEALEQGKLVAVVHSHTKGQTSPSSVDMVGQRQTGVPWVIVVHEDAERIVDEFSFPLSKDAPVEGIEFRSGVADCVECISRFFWHNYGIVIDGGPRDHEWWLGSEENPQDAPDMFLDLYEREGFRRLAPHEIFADPDNPKSQLLLKRGDVGLTRVMSPNRLNHGVIYTGGQMMLHHLFGRVSREEPLSRWLPRIEVWLRHTELEKETAREDDPPLR